MAVINASWVTIISEAILAFDAIKKSVVLMFHSDGNERYCLALSGCEGLLKGGGMLLWYFEVMVPSPSVNLLYYIVKGILYPRSNSLSYE